MIEAERVAVVSILAAIALAVRCDEPTEAERAEVEAAVCMALKPWVG